MKYFYFFLLLCLSDWAAAQNFIYKKDGTHIYGQIIKVDKDKIKYITGDDKKNSQRFSLKLSDIVLVFNQYGGFLCFDKGESQQSQSDVDNFINQGQTVRNNDLIFDDQGNLKPARYIDEKGDSVIIAQGGKQTSLAKSSLVAIIRKDGTHTLYKSASQAETYLIDYTNGSKHSMIDQMLKLPEEPAPIKIAPVYRAAAAPVRGQAQPGVSPSTSSAIAPPNKEYLKSKGMEKIKSFEADLKTISDPASSNTESSKSIDLACDLFTEDSRIQVSSLNNIKIKSAHVRFYLTSLQRNASHYSKVTLTFASLNWASNFLPNPDGTYSAVVTCSQEYTAYADGKPVYQDVTTKNITLKIKKVKKIEASGIVESWDVFLGDISVLETAPN